MKGKYSVEVLECGVWQEFSEHYELEEALQLASSICWEPCVAPAEVLRSEAKVRIITPECKIL